MIRMNLRMLVRTGGLKKFAALAISAKGALKNYVDRRGWVGGQSNVFVIK